LLYLAAPPPPHIQYRFPFVSLHIRLSFYNDPIKSLCARVYLNISCVGNLLLFTGKRIGNECRLRFIFLEKKKAINFPQRAHSSLIPRTLHQKERKKQTE
jgi:hypothetical protein